MKSLMRSTMVPYWGGNYQLLDDAPPVPPHGVSPGGDVRLEPGAFTPRMPENKVKCVLVGDGAVGKTSLIVSYTTNGYPTSYVPTAFDNYSVVVAVDGKPTQLELCDTAGQDEFDLLRPLCYPNADVFLLCFSVVVPSSFHNAEFVWMPEIRRHAPCTPLLLVGTQADLRDDVQVLIGLAERGERPVSVPEARRFAAQEGAAVYVECSALTQKNLKEVFDLAILAGLGRNSRPLSRRRKKCHKKGCATDKVRSLSKTWWKKYTCFG